MSTQCWQLYCFPIQVELFLFLRKKRDVCLKPGLFGCYETLDLIYIFCESKSLPLPPWLGVGRGWWWVRADMPRLHPSGWRVKTYCLRKGVNAPAPHPTPAETTPWGRGAGPGYCWVRVRVQAPM
ncbi:unnamed protein product [Rangifer tarandus platyrhynchus]|uniref:Uncharacterized protein n=1 Tax=Rangifer tarandus platyrhynchus TaxID=3082113 RepID=A0AC59ZVR4_RANTA